MSVGRICCREVDLAAADESVLGAARRMGREGVGTLVVLGEDRRPLGLLTDRDIVLRVLLAERDPQTTRIGEIMSRDPTVIEEHAPIESALSLMRAGGFRRLPVVDGERRLVGIVSLDDILTLLAEEFAHIGGLLKRQGA